MVEGERTLLFSGNYPNWELGDPFAMIEDIPAALRRRVLVDNALAVYGERLLLAAQRAETRPSGGRPVPGRAHGVASPRRFVLGDGVDDGEACGRARRGHPAGRAEGRAGGRARGRHLQPGGHVLRAQECLRAPGLAGLPRAHRRHHPALGGLRVQVSASRGRSCAAPGTSGSTTSPPANRSSIRRSRSSATRSRWWTATSS